MSTAEDHAGVTGAHRRPVPGCGSVGPRAPRAAARVYAAGHRERRARSTRPTARPATGRKATACAGVNLGSGKFRRASTDDEMVRIIIGGIPGTAMPPSTSRRGRPVPSWPTCARLPRRQRGTAIPGDAGRGRPIFEGKGQCLTCHSVGGSGCARRAGADRVGALRRAVELQRSLVEPSGEIRSDNRPVRVVTPTGATITGRLLNQDTFSMQLLDSSERLVLAREVERCASITILEGLADAIVQGQADASGTGRRGQLSDDRCKGRR